MNANKFNVGDRVVITDTDYESDFLANGCSGVVAELYRGGAYGVRLDAGERPTDFGGVGWTFFGDQIEKVKE